jgi:3-deoxy-D-manno-octulosonate 8-phosphate phosphatase (KDO 8-P phosphatase)
VSRTSEHHPWPPGSDQAYRSEVDGLVGTELADRLAAVKLLVLDADGVLTSGNLIYSAQGEALKEFHSHDGLGLVLARTVGVKRAVLTGRNSLIVERRCTELRFDAIKLGRFDKVAALHEIWQETGCSPGETLYMGDDLIDLPAMHACGLAVTVPGAPTELVDFCALQTAAAGGRGAVREIIDLVLTSAGLFRLAMSRIVDPDWQPSRAELSSDGESAAPQEDES